MSFEELEGNFPEFEEEEKRNEEFVALDDGVAWECGASAYDLGDRVGKGAFAEVYCAVCNTGPRQGTAVAIKVSRVLVRRLF
jgi:hypothetical protein